jgi:hypothetical protein
MDNLSILNYKWGTYHIDNLQKVNMILMEKGIFPPKLWKTFLSVL